VSAAAGPGSPPAFGAALACIDGRTHEPLVAWIRAHHGVDHVDLVTQPGVDAVLEACSPGGCAELRDRVRVSVDAHRAAVIAVVGHDDCAANPVSPEEHRSQVLAAVEGVRRWDLGPEVVGLWVDREGRVERLDEAGVLN
jgi:hypothetical protein